MIKSRYFYLTLLLILLIIPSLTLFLARGGFSDITGRLQSMVFVNTRTQILCPVTIYPGWNLVSFYCQADSMAVDSIFLPPDPEEGNTSLNLSEDLNLSEEDLLNASSVATIANLTIFAYDPANSTDQWKVYQRGLPEWVRLDLNELSIKKGYWIRADEVYLAEINGTLRVPEFIVLRSGWNLAGFPLNETQPLSYALNGILAKVLTIHKYESQSADQWKLYSASALPEQNDLETMEPTYGYWIEMNGSGTWLIDR
jgi:hypothetical protein